MALPQGLPPQMIQDLVQRLTTPQAGPGPMPGTQPAGPGPPMPPPGTMPPPQAGPPMGAPQAPTPMPATGAPPQAPGAPGPPEQKGLSDEQTEMLKTLMGDPEARKQIQELAKKVAGEKRDKGQMTVDPARRMVAAQGWNARSGGLALQMNVKRSAAPGTSVASDEALLRIWFMTPLAGWAPADEPFPIPLADIDEYADQVRIHLIKNGWTDPDQIEDQVTRECFPLREMLIKTGRGWRQQVEFTDQMLALTDRWLKKYGKLPDPDLKVLARTKEGKGDPESQTRDTDSEAYPPGGYRNPLE